LTVVRPLPECGAVGQKSRKKGWPVAFMSSIDASALSVSTSVT
jgi:hypothetical protein